jgi:hypothetical protein
MHAMCRIRNILAIYGVCPPIGSKEKKNCVHVLLPRYRRGSETSRKRRNRAGEAVEKKPSDDAFSSGSSMHR